MSIIYNTGGEDLNINITTKSAPKVHYSSFGSESQHVCPGFATQPENKPLWGPI